MKSANREKNLTELINKTYKFDKGNEAPVNIKGYEILDHFISKNFDTLKEVTNRSAIIGSGIIYYNLLHHFSTHTLLIMY